MKKLSLKSLIFAMALSMGIILLALPSCRSVRSVESLKSNVESQEVHDSQLSTFDIQHSALRDSIIYRERTIHDTVYITKEVYRDQRLSTFDIQHLTKADTVVVTEYRDRVVEKPPEKYIPPFYKRCTTILFIILAAGVVWIVGKWYIRLIL